MVGASFRGADLREASLAGSNFGNADLTDAILSGGNLTEADLTGATVTNADFANVTWSNTVCPDGTNSDDNGGVCDL